MYTPFIPFANPHAAYARRSEEILQAIGQVLDSGIYILGQEVDLLQAEFVQWLMGSAEQEDGMACLGVGNGTDAIELALRGHFVCCPEHAPARLAARGKAGAAVITVSHTAVATVAAIERAGAVPVLADIDPRSLTLHPDAMRQAVALAQEAGLQPVAVVPVHIYGHPCDMDPLLELAAQEGLFVLEDCAQAVGASYKGRKVGTLGHAAAFSCYPTKNLGALGDAGLVCTRQKDLMAEMRALAQYGWKERYISALPGINTRLDPVQAAILRVNLRYLEEDLAQRRHWAAWYNKALATAPVGLPQTLPHCEHGWHLYVLRVAGVNRRNALLAYLRERGIGAALHYPQPVHRQPAYAGRVLLAGGALPHTEALYDTLLTLPFFPHMRQEEAQRVVDAVLAFEEAQ